MKKTGIDYVDEPNYKSDYGDDFAENGDLSTTIFLCLIVIIFGLVVVVCFGYCREQERSKERVICIQHQPMMVRSSLMSTKTSAIKIMLENSFKNGAIQAMTSNLHTIPSEGIKGVPSGGLQALSCNVSGSPMFSGSASHRISTSHTYSPHHHHQTATTMSSVVPNGPVPASTSSGGPASGKLVMNEVELLQALIHQQQQKQMRMLNSDVNISKSRIHEIRRQRHGQIAYKSCESIFPDDEETTTTTSAFFRRDPAPTGLSNKDTSASGSLTLQQQLQQLQLKFNNSSSAHQTTLPSAVSASASAARANQEIGQSTREDSSADPVDPYVDTNKQSKLY